MGCLGGDPAKALDDGLIGEPLGAFASVLSRGMEMWHPDPTFFYQPGAGPLFDLGPYYLTALVHLLGPISKVKSVRFSEKAGVN